MMADAEAMAERDRENTAVLHLIHDVSSPRKLSEHVWL
jgi:hypothetical protein